MSYAAQKGNGIVTAPVVKPEEQEIAPLTAKQMEQVANNYALVKKHMPEVIPALKELHKLGMIDGARAIQNVQVFNGKEP